MPSLEEWEAALSVIRYINVNSTDNLAQRVNQKPGSKSFSGVSKTAIGLPKFSPPRRVSLLSTELLFALGRLTTPKIENLADLCSTWARIRYIWAFVPDQFPSNLRLSEEALNIDFHQKGLLSDEIGVGMSALIVERYFGGLNPVDVSVALQNNLIPGLKYKYPTSPDYIFDRSDGGYIVVECKGTQSGDSTSLKQLKRGTEQLPSLVFQSDENTLSLVIGTSLSDSGTTVNIIDPPDNFESNIKPGKYIIKNDRKFRRDLDLTQISNLYLYAGATSKAANIVPSLKTKSRLEKLPQREQPPEELDFPEIEEKYLGISQEIRLIGDVNRVNIFQGLTAKVYGALQTQEKETIYQQAFSHYQKAIRLYNQANMQDFQSDQPGPYFIERGDKLVRANVFGKDGTLLRIEVASV